MPAAAVVRSDGFPHLMVCAVTRNIRAFKKAPAPPFEAEERPDQQSVIRHGGGMLLNDPAHVRGIEKLVDPCIVAAQQAADVIDAFTGEPARVRRRKSLLPP